MHRLLYIVLCLCGGVAVAQNNKVPATTEYFHLYGGRNFDEFRSIKELPDGNYLLAGTSESFGQGTKSAYLVKTDVLGNFLWSNAYGGGNFDVANTLEVTADSGYLVAGYSNSFNPPNGYDGWYFKTDKNGNVLWQKIVSGDDWDFLYGSAPLSDGGFVLCGETYTNSNGSADAWLVRISASGDTLWTHHYGGLQDEWFNKVCVMNNSLYAVGTNFTHGTDSVNDGWIVKLDLNGNVLGEAFAPTQHHYGEEFNGITPYDASTFFVCGKTDLTDSSSTQSLISRMDTSLNFMFGPYLGGNTFAGEYVSFNKIINTSYGNICAVGTATGGFGGKNMFIVGYHAGLTWITDFAHDCGRQYDEFGYDGVYTTAGRLILVGNAQQLCTSSGLGLEDGFLVRFDSDSITNSNITNTQLDCFSDTLFYWASSLQTYQKDVRVSLFPNPANDKAQLHIETQSTADLTVCIYSVLGNEVKRLAAAGNGNTELDLSGLGNGTYFIKLLSKNGEHISVMKFIISHG